MWIKGRLAVCLLLSCSFDSLLAAQPAAGRSNTVVWLSVDGLRHDYIERFAPPELSKLAHEGAYTNQERPIFPSLTFPNHVAQATGTTVDHHGVVMNGWYDTQLKEAFNFPDRPELLRAEPIWLTAERQGVRVAVVDWPMSENQSAPLKTDYFDPNFDQKETDAHRLARVVQLLKADHNQKPLRLVMSYLSWVDHIGHQSGPESPEVAAAVLQADSEIKTFADETIDWFTKTHGADDELYLIISTDHGMQPVTVQVNLDRLIGIELVAGVKIVTSGPMACVYLLDVPAERRAARLVAIQDKLRTIEYLNVWPANDLPKRFHFADPSRAGDLVALLKPGYTFTTGKEATTKPVTAGAGKATHGYDPDSTPNLLGSALIWRLRKPIGGVDIGPISNTQWHATVAKLLGIEPSKDADARLIPLPEGR